MDNMAHNHSFLTDADPIHQLSPLLHLPPLSPLALYWRNFYQLLVSQLKGLFLPAWNQVAVLACIWSHWVLHDFLLQLSLSFEYDAKHWGNRRLSGCSVSLCFGGPWGRVRKKGWAWSPWWLGLIRPTFLCMDLSKLCAQIVALFFLTKLLLFFLGDFWYEIQWLCLWTREVFFMERLDTILT